MDYRTLFKEDNDRIRERYDLAVWRIEQILEEHSVCPPYDRFFEENARWILMCDRLLTALERDELESADPSVWPQIHDRLYETMYGSKMQDSWGNPDYAKRHLGNELGPYLSCLYGIIRSIIPAVWEYRRVPITVCMELFIEIYNDFEYEKVTAKMVRRAIYWFISDYADEFMTYKIRELTDSRLDRYERIFWEAADGQNEMALYTYGMFVSDSAVCRWRRWRNADKTEIENRAQECVRAAKQTTLTGSGGRCLLSCYIGDEPIAAAAAKQLGAEGYDPFVIRGSVFGVSGLTKGAGLLADGCMAYIQAHRGDILYYADRALYERYFSVAQSTFEKYSSGQPAASGYVCIPLSSGTSCEEHKEFLECGNVHVKDYCAKMAALEQKYLGTGAQTSPIVLV